MNNHATILAGWALVQQAVLNDRGLDVEALYTAEGLDATRATDPEYRYPAVPFNRIWVRAQELTADCTLGIDAARFVLPTTFHALGLAMWSSATLEEALRRLDRYSRIFHTGGRAKIQYLDGEIQLDILRESNADSTILVTDPGLDCFLSSLVNLFRQLLRAPFNPRELSLTRPTPRDDRPYRDFFQCPIHFGAAVDRITLDYPACRQALPSGNSLLAAINDGAAEDYLTRFDLSDLYLQLTRAIRTNLERGDASIESAAKAVGMSVRSLQRTLRERDTSYKTVLNEVRREAASSYLRQSALSLGEVSYRLGFSHVNNFTRAFKDWFGVSPSRFRQSLSRPRSPETPA